MVKKIIVIISVLGMCFLLGCSRLQSTTTSIQNKAESKNIEQEKQEETQNEIKKATYVPPDLQIPQGKKQITFFYPNYNQKLLVPLTKYVQSAEKNLEAVMKALHDPLYKELGLSPKPPIDQIPKIQIQGDTVIIDIDGKSDSYHHSVEESYMYYASIYHSIKQFSSIRKVQFLVDGTKQKEIFYGTMQCDNPLEILQLPEVFLGYSTQNRKYLVPLPIQMLQSRKVLETSIEDLSQEIFQQLQKAYQYKGVYLGPTIAQNIKLLQVKKENHTLYLSLSKEFLTAYGNDYNAKRMMLDAMIYSFTSIPQVEYVKLTVEGRNIKEYVGIQLDQAIKRYKGVNPIL